MTRNTPVVLGFAALGVFALGCNEINLEGQPVPPVAVLDGPVTALATQTVEINGEDSYDPNASQAAWPGIATYRWSILEEPDGSQATIDGWRHGQLVTDLPGAYTVQLEVRDDNERLWSVPELWHIQVMPITGFYAELTWTTDVNDVDLHLLDETQGGGLFDEMFDCHFANLRPDWGLAGLDTDNPSLSLDDVDGYGPEVAELAEPVATEQYGYVVHYFSDDGFGDTDATVKIYINGSMVQEMTRVLRPNDVWDVGMIDWQGANTVFTVRDTMSTY